MKIESKTCNWYEIVYKPFEKSFEEGYRQYGNTSLIGCALKCSGRPPVGFCKSYSDLELNVEEHN